MPEVQALNSGILELHDLADSVMMTPLLALNDLYLAGLSCTDLAFMRTHNRLGALRTTLPQCQRLVSLSKYQGRTMLKGTGRRSITARGSR